VTGVFYSPLILIADLDGDGNDEVVAISHEQIWAFDAKKGGQKFYAATVRPSGPTWQRSRPSSCSLPTFAPPCHD